MQRIGRRTLAIAALVALLAIVLVAGLIIWSSRGGLGGPLDLSASPPLYYADGSAAEPHVFPGEYALLNFCAEQVEVCGRQMELMADVMEQYGSEAFHVAVVRIGGSLEEIRHLADETGYDGPLLLDPSGRVAETVFSIRRAPATLFLRPNETVARQFRRRIDMQSVDELVLDILPNPPAPDRSSPLTVATDFSLSKTSGEVVRLSDQLAAGPAVLVFIESCG